MNKSAYILIVLSLFLISFVSAETIIAGNNYTFKVETIDNLYWDVVGNSSNMEGFDVYQDIYTDYSNITFTTDYRMRPDSFTIILFSEKTKEIIKEVEVGGDCPSCKRRTKIITEYINKYITEYKDKIIIDDEEIQRLNDELKKRQDEIDKRNRALILSLVGFLALLCIIMFFIYKLVKKIKNA